MGKLDGKVVKTVHIDKTNIFTFDNELVLEGKDLTSDEMIEYFKPYGTYSMSPSVKADSPAEDAS